MATGIDSSPLPVAHLALPTETRIARTERQATTRLPVLAGSAVVSPRPYPMDCARSKAARRRAVPRTLPSPSDVLRTWQPPPLHHVKHLT